MKNLVYVFIAVFFGVMFMGVLSAPTITSSHSAMSDCPFMTDDQLVCPMNLADQVGAWKSLFTAIPPVIVLLLLVSTVAVYVLWCVTRIADPWRFSIPIVYKQLQERTYTYWQRALQEWFARGILHPNVYVS